jgi:hypothetical protein
MRDELALSRYLSRHAEKDLPTCPVSNSRWQHVLVLPAYDESPQLLDVLAKQQPDDGGMLLVILVLNRPDNDSNEHTNDALRSAIQTRSSREHPAAPESIYTLNIHSLNSSTDLYLYDMERLRGPCPSSEGVGLARKLGCDIALHWMNGGAINSQWLCCTDADAELPVDYFSRVSHLSHSTVAATFPFCHRPANDDVLTTASTLYELRLHHYVLGLEHAGSNYAMHTLGSCMAIRASAYAHVRGVPRRNAAEDFYLLNKLVKIGTIERLPGACIRLSSRASERVPFGTGPSLAAIRQLEDPLQALLFYDPQCFIALQAVLHCLHTGLDSNWQLHSALEEQGLQRTLARSSVTAMETLGLEKSITHCRRQNSTQKQFDKHMQQWFDGFRTLKFIHALRDRGLPLLSLAQLDSREPTLWPESDTVKASPHDRISNIQQHWQWLA